MRGSVELSGYSPNPRSPWRAPVWSILNTANTKRGPVTLDDYNYFCASLPHANHVVQWGGGNVWKVATKLFAVAWQNEADGLWVTFKCSQMSFELLKDQPGLRPAPYLASRGMLWIQRTSDASMDDAALRDYLRESHRLAALKLPKKTQKELGLGLG